MDTKEDINNASKRSPKSPILQARQSNFYTEGIEHILSDEYHIPISKDLKSFERGLHKKQYEKPLKSTIREKLSDLIGAKSTRVPTYSLSQTTKALYKIYDSDYSKRKLRKHLIVEIFNGNHYRWECQCSELLQAINKHSSRCPTEYESLYSTLFNENNQDHIPFYSEEEDKSEELSFQNSDTFITNPNFAMGAGKLTYRDCRQVLTDVQQIPSLEVRRHCIVICLPPVTCFILHDRVFLVVVEELRIDSLIQQLVNLTEASHKHKSKPHRPFEFLALECLISAAFEQLNDDILSLEQQYLDIERKSQLAKDPTSVVMEELHHLKQPVDVYKDRVKGFDKAFNELIADTEDLKQMELSHYFAVPELYNTNRKLEEPNQDLLILLEYFDQELDQFHNRVNHLYNSISNADRLLSLRLSINRNKLIKYDLGISILEASIAIGTCVSGIFGMNLMSGLENKENLFMIVSLLIFGSVFTAIPIVIYMWKRMIL